MNLDFTDEQRLLQSTVQRFVADHYSLAHRNAVIAGSDGFSREHWRQFAELGWLALPFDEAHGGIGGSAIDTMVLMEELGRGLVVEPYLANVVLAGGVLRRSATAAQQAALLPALIDGSRQFALAWAENGDEDPLAPIGTVARPDGAGFIIDGTKTVVWHAATADHLLVTAADREGAGQSMSYFRVDAGTAGLKVDSYPTVDGLRAAEVELRGVRVGAEARIGDAGAASASLAAVIDDGILAVCAESVGILATLYKDTVDYTRQREQFGHPLSDFQTLRHRMVDMFVEHEQCRSMLLRATLGVASGNPDARSDVHALKYLIGRAGQFIAENAVQLHGGMGVTEELRVGHYFKRQLVIESQFGSSDEHLARFTRTGG